MHYVKASELVSVPGGVRWPDGVVTRAHTTVIDGENVAIAIRASRKERRAAWRAQPRRAREAWLGHRVAFPMPDDVVGRGGFDYDLIAEKGVESGFIPKDGLMPHFRARPERNIPDPDRKRDSLRRLIERAHEAGCTLLALAYADELNRYEARGKKAA